MWSGFSWVGSAGFFACVFVMAECQQTMKFDYASLMTVLGAYELVLSAQRIALRTSSRVGLHRTYAFL
jgi:hypothetical protein